MAVESNDVRDGEKKNFWILIRKNFWGVVTLIAVTIVCVVIVQVYKKPGQMSVLESVSYTHLTLPTKA